ncbi:transglycosylase SLT domain-containing protein [Roseateles saccharophilus]|uniref:Transglycosylase-like protein with SLT domain n=1 Tax=Roseateles saccharophilus TaxID=304 RepID=A0A4R3VBW6_ROSSA|nr:transglycosylase SLT domain-containing protein [Roseateles saccharophilus]TCV01104.1 transglycosylase-like protein with SLT domain [Roseateles saccharophilus]
MRSLLLPLFFTASAAMAQGLSPAPALTLEQLPRPTMPPGERGPVVPAQVERWREEARALEYGDGVKRDEVAAAKLYCRAARYGDAEAQYSLGWMLTNARGIQRNDAEAAHMFAAAAEQGMSQAQNMLDTLGGTPLGDPPPCLRPPETDPAPVVPAPPPSPRGARPVSLWAALPLPANAPPAIVSYVKLVAPEYQLAPALVLAVMAQESNFDPLAESPKKAQGLMQLMPETGTRFNVLRLRDPSQNIRGGMAYLRWLLAYYEGDVQLALAAYNAGEKAVDRYLGVPPYAETRMYVRRIMATVGGQRLHPFDARVTEASAMLQRVRAAMQAIQAGRR